MKLHLENFDGPLDLLLHLVKNAKIDIKDVFVSTVTKQFLEFIESAKKKDIELAASYLVVAATILEIKSRELLPKYQEEVDEESEEDILIRQLEEYKLFKELTEELKEKHETEVFYRENQEEVVPTYSFSETDINLLVEAFSRVLLYYSDKPRSAGMEQRTLAKETMTVAMVIVEMEEIIAKGSLSFFAFFGESPSREKIVVTFLAILEMVKMGKVEVTQENNFKDILIIGKNNG